MMHQEHTAKMFPYHGVTESTENLLFLSVAPVTCKFRP